jgi:23S rRNA (cytidine1920-2'-O)/16S rRNA (cytidine1409-2'-O)-methyltransferase
MRIDLYLSQNGYAESRTEAKNLITSGKVHLGGTLITKPSYDITEENPEIIILKSENTFASRGGYKLLGALRDFRVDPTDRLAIDIGASSGGFTDCLLQKGASHVIALDSGTMQIKDFLRRDPRVTVIEGYNARYMKKEDFEYTPNLAVMDVSFISATYIIPAVYSVLQDEADFICLIKPQFEVGKAGIGKGGIVKDDKLRRAAVDGVVEFAKTVGFNCLGLIKSPILGGDGNIEYLAYFKK